MSDDLDIPSAPTGVPTDVEAHVKLMFDLQAIAWQADITRVSTMLMAKGSLFLGRMTQLWDGASITLDA